MLGWGWTLAKGWDVSEAKCGTKDGFSLFGMVVGSGLGSTETGLLWGLILSRSQISGEGTQGGPCVGRGLREPMLEAESQELGLG